jgi:hypothetical protein
LLSDHKKGKIVEIVTSFHHHSDEQKREYVRDVLDSKFVLCPRGSSPSSYRLFEVMELGRCPVVISDDWIRISGVRWEDCAIFVPETDIDQIPIILEQHEHRAAELGGRAREAWEANFSHLARFRAMLDMLIQIRNGLLSRPVDHRRRWSSWRFYYENGWTVPQRAAKRMQRHLQGLQESN